MPIKKTQRIIVLKDKKEREKILKVLAERGGKILHDSGERVLIVEVPKFTRLKGSIPRNSKLMKLNENIRKQIIRPNKHELLFIDALKLKASKKFINEKKQREPGSTPEEQEMLLESDYLGDDMDNI